jgi:hypothetical protein
MFPYLNIKDISGYLNQLPPDYGKLILDFKWGIHCAIPHVLSFMKYVSTLKERHEYVLTIPFLLYLGQKQKD